MQMLDASMRGAHPHAIVYRPLTRARGLGAPLTLVYRRHDCAGPTGTFIALTRQIAVQHRARQG